MKLLIDASLSPGWVHVLVAGGFEAIHWFNVGAPNAPDREIMKFAQEHGYAVITHDLDFSAILFDTGLSRPSVVQIRSKDVNPVAIGAVVTAELRSMRQQIIEGAVVTIDLKRTRLRVLPFKTPDADTER